MERKQTEKERDLLQSPPNRLPPTCEDTVGPYYPLSFTDGDRTDLSQVHPGLVLEPRGRPIEIEGRVLDINGQLASGALLEFWQPDADGRLHGPDVLADPDIDPYFEGYTRIRANGGTFRLRTVMPGGSNAQDGQAARAPYITLTIFSDGFSRIITQLFFEGEQGNAEDPVLLAVPPERRDALVVRRTAAVRDGADVYRIDLILAGPGETPFFDDLGDTMGDQS